MPRSLLDYGTKKKRSAQQLAQLNNLNTTVRQSVKENHPPAPRKSTRGVKEPILKTPDGRVITLSAHLKTEALLGTTQNLLGGAELRVNQARKQAEMERARADALEKRANHYQNLYYNANRKAIRAGKLRKEAWNELATLKREHKASEAEALKTISCMRKQSERTDTQLKHEIGYLEERANRLTGIIRCIRRENCRLKLDARYVPERIQRSVAKAVAKMRRIQLRDKGIYTPKARALMLELRKLGVPAAAIKGTFRAFAASWDVEIDCAPDAHTVKRVEGEGYIAGRIQMIEEMLAAKGTPH